jgi:uncharacterized protein
MKKFLIFLISIYQNVISPIQKMVFGVTSHCGYEITCSNFARNAINEQGVIKGTAVSLKRLLFCNPYNQQIVKI